jgi:hypothetical protein
VSEDPGAGIVFDSASFDEGSQGLLAAHGGLEAAAAKSAGVVQGSAGAGRRLDDLVTADEPADVATGDVVPSQVDARLPARSMIWRMSLSR